MIVDTMNGQRGRRESGRGESAVCRKQAVSLTLMLLACVGASGCGRSRPIKYYQLTAPESVAPATAPTLPVTLVVRMPAASGLYRDSRVVYAIGEQQMGSYEYDRWVGPPAEMIQTALLRSLRASGRYADVVTPQARAGGDYALSTRIYDFKEQDSGSTLVGRLSMDIELRNLTTGDTVWHSYYIHDEPIGAKTVKDVVAALNRNVQLATSNISSGLEQYFASHPPK